MIKNFSTKRHATFKDCDSAGIIFFNKVFEYTHDNLEDLNRKLGTWEIWFNSPEYAAPIVSCSSEFKSPIKLGQEILINVSDYKVGSKSIAFDFSITDSKAHVFALVSTTHVFLSKKTGKPCEIPPEIKSKLN